MLCRETLGHDAKAGVLFGNALSCLGSIGSGQAEEERRGEGSNGVRSMWMAQKIPGSTGQHRNLAHRQERMQRDTARGDNL